MSNGSNPAPESEGDIKARVLAMVAEYCSDDACPIHSELERCVDDAIARHQRVATIHTFLPLIAFRDVRECIRQGSCPDQTAAIAQ